MDATMQQTSAHTYPASFFIYIWIISGLIGLFLMFFNPHTFQVNGRWSAASTQRLVLPSAHSYGLRWRHTHLHAHPGAPVAGFADLQWVDGEPFSRQFNDIYFFARDGLEETRYVFLENNNLPRRFPLVQEFTIAETGFGTGLNFLAAWELWDKTPKVAGATLHFVSVEKFPLSPDDLRKAVNLFPSLDPWSRQLLASYSTIPFEQMGPHRMTFADGSVELVLWIGDVIDVLPQWQSGMADAWFLDGFAPLKNDVMWSDEVLREVVRIAAKGGTLSSFTSVGRIRRALQELGMQMSKSKGYGTKREMMRGVK